MFAGPGVRLPGVLLGNLGSFCSPLSKDALPIPNVLHVFLMEHDTLERQSSCISIQGFRICGF